MRAPRLTHPTERSMRFKQNSNFLPLEIDQKNNSWKLQHQENISGTTYLTHKIRFSTARATIMMAKILENVENQKLKK